MLSSKISWIDERPNPAMSIKLAVDTFCCVVCRADSRLLSSDQSAIRGSLACSCVVCLKDVLYTNCVAASAARCCNVSATKLSE